MKRGFMKQHISFKFLLVFAATAGALSLMSCSGGSGSSTPQVVVTGSGVETPDGSGFNDDDFSDGGQTVAFKPVSFSVMNTYVGTHPLNDPSDYKINIQLTKIPNTLFYSGKIKLGYYDASIWFQTIFETGDGRNVKCSNCLDNNEYEAKFNYFYDASGKKVFSGYFQDKYGGVIVVLEPAAGSGDADSGAYKGSLFFRNFGQTFATQSSYRKCWFIYEGPYTCKSGTADSKSNYTSFSEYTKLGTFTGIDLTQTLQ